MTRQERRRKSKEEERKENSVKQEEFVPRAAASKEGFTGHPGPDPPGGPGPESASDALERGLLRTQEEELVPGGGQASEVLWGSCCTGRVLPSSGTPQGARRERMACSLRRALGAGPVSLLLCPYLLWRSVCPHVSR